MILTRSLKAETRSLSANFVRAYWVPGPIRSWADIDTDPLPAFKVLKVFEKNYTDNHRVINAKLGINHRRNRSLSLIHI